MFIQELDDVYSIDFNGLPKSSGGKSYGDIFKDAEKEYSEYNFEKANVDKLFNEFDNCLYFDISTNHYRDIAKISLQDSAFSMVLYDNQWDERNIAFAGNGSLIYSDDRSGIFNLYLIDDENEKQGYATNVFGGAFMPHINKKGEVLYSLYDNGGYKIAIIDSLQLIDEALVGYSKTYYQKNENLSDPIVTADTT